MMPRRGYEPVEDVEEIADGDVHGSVAESGRRSAYTSISPGNAIEDASSDEDEQIAPLDGRDAIQPALEGAERAGATNDDEMNVRILDVKGQTYSLMVQASTTIRQLKMTLVDVAGVEMARQRIIWSGRILGDSDTLAGRNVTDGAAMHLFQRPKHYPGGAGLGNVPAQLPGRLHEIPPLLLHVQERNGELPQTQGYLDSHWEIEVPRRSLRFLACLLLMMSIMSLLQRVAAMVSPAPAEDGAHPVLVLRNWTLLQEERVSSVIGVIVGLLGVRGSHSLSGTTIRLYLAGLVVCAVLTMAIRLEVLYDVISGKMPFEEYNAGSSSTQDPSTHGPSDSSGAGAGDDGKGDGGYEPTHERDASSLYFSAFSSLLAAVVSGAVWLFCIRRVNTARTEIATYVENRERQLQELEEARREHTVGNDVLLEEGAVAVSADF